MKIYHNGVVRSFPLCRKQTGATEFRKRVAGRKTTSFFASASSGYALSGEVGIQKQKKIFIFNIEFKCVYFWKNHSEYIFYYSINFLCVRDQKRLEKDLI
jgi:hypothetical protein